MLCGPLPAHRGTHQSWLPHPGRCCVSVLRHYPAGYPIFNNQLAKWATVDFNWPSTATTKLYTSRRMPAVNSGTQFYTTRLHATVLPLTRTNFDKTVIGYGRSSVAHVPCPHSPNYRHTARTRDCPVLASGSADLHPSARARSHSSPRVSRTPNAAPLLP